MNKKAMMSMIKAVLIGGLVVGILIYAIVAYIYPNWNSILGSSKSDETQSTFFKLNNVGLYNDNQKGKLPDGCTQDGNNYVCKEGSMTDFFVNIQHIKDGEKRYFYPAPCIIEDDEEECKDDDYFTSFRPCGIVERGTADCVVGRTWTMQAGTYRVYPGAKCLADDCYSTSEIGVNDYKVNYDSFFEIEVQ